MCRDGGVAWGMDSGLDFQVARALLAWQVELGADEAICDAPVNRFDLPKKKPASAASTPAPAPAAEAAAAPRMDGAAVAAQAAGAAGSLEELHAALKAFDLCDLKRGAKNTVFADGSPKARVMVIGEAPGRDEDIQGRPFVGRAGQLLDRMFAAIGMARDHADSAASVYITNILPWRPPQNRDPKPDEISMMLPFVKRHVELVGPDLLVLMGNISCQAILGRRGITRLRGNWTSGLGLPVLPMFHPAYLLRNPAAKREAWHDLLMLQARLREGA